MASRCKAFTQRRHLERLTGTLFWCCHVSHDHGAYHIPRSNMLQLESSQISLVKGFSFLFILFPHVFLRPRFIRKNSAFHWVIGYDVVFGAYSGFLVPPQPRPNSPSGENVGRWPEIRVKIRVRSIRRQDFFQACLQQLRYVISVFQIETYMFLLMEVRRYVDNWCAEPFRLACSSDHQWSEQCFKTVSQLLFFEEILCLVAN